MFCCVSGFHNLRADGGCDDGGAEQDLGEAHRAGGVQGPRPPAELLPPARSPSPRVLGLIRLNEVNTGAQNSLYLLFIQFLVLSNKYQRNETSDVVGVQVWVLLCCGLESFN